MRSNPLPVVLLVSAVGVAVLAVGLASLPGAAKRGTPIHVHSPFAHVMDPPSGEWPLLDMLGRRIVIRLPSFFGLFQITKYMILEVIAALLVVVAYVPLARRLQNGDPPSGLWENMLEWPLTFVREAVARPNLGDHDTDRFLPYLWTVGLFILLCHLLGMIPFAGSPTASIYVTGALAVTSFFAAQGAAIAKMGPVHYLKSWWPHIDIPIPGADIIIKGLILVIEIIGTAIKNFVLAVRLFANMFAGHTVLAVIMLFIVTAANAALGLWASITVGSVLGVVALSLLELFVAFLQTYIFLFLTALFIGMAVHPQH